MSKTILERLLEASPDDHEYYSNLMVRSMNSDIFIQDGRLCALVIKGNFFEEKEGRIIQLLALNDRKLEFNGLEYTIDSAKVSQAAYMHYDFVLVGENLERLELLLEYGTVRRMVERKTAVLDLTEDNNLLQELNDMHDGAFTINGEQFYIAGEQWTQSKPGHRDLMLIPASHAGGPQVTKAVPDELLKELISTGRTSFEVG